MGLLLVDGITVMYDVLGEPLESLTIWFGLGGMIMIASAIWVLLRPTELAYIAAAGVGLIAGALLVAGIAIGYMGTEIGSPGSGSKFVDSMFPWVIVQIAIVIIGGILAVTWKSEKAI